MAPATLCQQTCDCGLPWSSRSGWPVPPCRRKISAPLVRTQVASKPGNRPLSGGSGRAALCARASEDVETSCDPNPAAAAAMNCLRSIVMYHPPPILDFSFYRNQFDCYDNWNRLAVTKFAGGSMNQRLWPAGMLLAAHAFAANTLMAEPVTFNKDVLPILQQNCQTCHRPGNIAPMSFLTYETTRPWAKAMKAAVVTRKMPPWFADPQYGHFSNDPSLKQNDIDKIVKWAAGDPP